MNNETIYRKQNISNINFYLNLSEKEIEEQQKGPNNLKSDNNKYND